ncbi:MAG TPA: hypothetical protein VJ994_04460 [Paracoccaceae bacterium]|nr:hypothetical protein [Paracoccaceae bacterium]
MLRGDFGLSCTCRMPVSELIAERIVVSPPLTLRALALSTVVAIPSGVLAAARRGGPASGRRIRDGIVGRGRRMASAS